MGLFKQGFGEKLKGLFANGGLTDAFAQSSAFLNGDYNGAATIAQNSQLKRLTIAQRKKAVADQAQLDAAIDSDPLLNTPQLKAYAKANPKAYIENVMERFKTRQFDAGGGSVYTPGSAQPWMTAPRFDSDNNIYAPGNGAQTPQILQRGTKAIPVQPGGRVDAVDAISGEPRMTGGTTSNLDAIPTVEEGHAYRPGPGGRANQANWTPLAAGGAGPQTPPTFLGPAQ